MGVTTVHFHPGAVTLRSESFCSLMASRIARLTDGKTLFGTGDQILCSSFLHLAPEGVKLFSLHLSGLLLQVGHKSGTRLSFCNPYKRKKLSCMHHTQEKRPTSSCLHHFSFLAEWKPCMIHWHFLDERCTDVYHPTECRLEWLNKK